MFCSLGTLVLMWGAAAAAAAIVRYRELPLTTDYVWAPFLFVAATIVWVVVSRVISPNLRILLFNLWAASLVVTLAWAASSQTFGPAVLYGAITMTAAYTMLALMTTWVNTGHTSRGVATYGLVGGFTATATLLVAMLAFPERVSPVSGHFVFVGALCVTLLVIQAWTMWSYLKNNNRLLVIENTCIFAVMAPYTAGVNAFSSIAGTAGVGRRRR